MVARDDVERMDEEYARRLQRQYDLELRREDDGGPNERPPPVAPSPPRVPSAPSPPPPRGSRSGGSGSPRSPPRTPPRRSTQGGNRSSGAGRSPSSPPRDMSMTPPTSPCTPTSSASSSSTPPRHLGREHSAAELVDTILDQEYARKIEQQLRDEEMALRMQQKEMAEREAQRIRAQYGQRTTNPSTVVVRGQSIPVEHNNVTATLPRGSNNRGGGGGGGGGRGCCFLPRKICSCVIFTVVLSVTVALIFGLLGGGDVPIPYVPDIPDLGDIFMEDPWDGGSGPAETNAWRDAKKREGLDLTIINALTDDWYPYFGQSVQDWDGGTPDALSLKVTSSAPDPKCAEEVGKMKVCNGDYGNTGWKGVNEVMLQNEYIVLSVAKMNEYYLAGAREEEKQYTMCHEMGHGFGLGHSDENFFNGDLGTCMDYTNRPQNNQHPNESNFNLLLEVYGYAKVDRERDRRDLDLVGDVETATTEATAVRSPQHRQLGPPKKYEPFSSHGTAEERERANWRLLKRHPRNLGEVHELDLGDGVRVQAHVLLADDDDRDRARARDRKNLR